MPEPALKTVGGISYREAEPSQPTQEAAVVCVHGWPQSSYMWRHLLPAIAATGRRALAPRPSRLRRHAAGSARDLRTSCRGRRELAPRGRARSRRAHRPRHRWVDRPSLGMRPPRGRVRAGDHEHGLLPRRRMGRDRGDDAHAAAGRGTGGQPLPRGLRHPAWADLGRVRRTLARRVLEGVQERRGTPRDARALSLVRARRARALSRSGSPHSACPRSSSGARRTNSSRSTMRRASRARSQAPSSCCSRAFATSSSRTSPSAARTEVTDFLARTVD